MRKVFAVLSFVTFLFFNNTVQSQQNDPVIVTIGPKKITKSEFLRTYTKNNPEGKFDRKSLDDYMQLFINFKLKVIEAEHLGMDTLSSFVSEYNSYREQLARPYLIDKETEEKLVREAYDRLHYDVHARQIFIRCGELLPPADTVEPYKKAWEAYNKLKAGVPWDSVFDQYAQDNYALKTKGDVGYFTALQMIYPFENVAYSLKPGEIAPPLRTHLGYHIIQVLDKRPSLGEIKVQHIMVAFPENATRKQIDSAKAVIDDLYQKLQNGARFEDLASQYSDDKRTAKRGGELDWFGTGQMIAAFEKEAFALKNDGDYSAPFKTDFGWHIVKRIAVRPISPYDNLKESLRNRVNRDRRGELIKVNLAEKVKKEFGFKENHQALKELAKYIDSTAYRAEWKPEKAKPIEELPIFTIGNKTYKIKDFTPYLAKRRFRKPATIDMSINYFYGLFAQEQIIDYYKSQLENKYPDFRFLLQEFHDGILLFNLMEKMVWTKAAKDSAGLAQYYQQHKDEYQWKQRVEALVVSSPDKEYVDKAYAYAQDFLNSKISSENIWKAICPDTTQACFNCQVNLFEKGDNTILDSIGWEIGVSPIVFREGKYGFFVKKALYEPRPKTFEEAKGTCLADYQNYLENQYLAELRKKYPVKVEEKVLQSLVK
ncbi:MAG TPA: peptidylprolyl isomerase [Bacteroidales bacterium]|nr:peptidylprolyl isomerase [Bacteroidales bacterium]